MNLREFFTNHAWWGRLCGAFLGYLIAGPIGALFGLMIGNIFDHGLAEHFSKPHWHYHAEKRVMVQKIFFEATFSVMGYLAKSDGRVSENEIRMANTLMEEMGLKESERKEARFFFAEGKNASFDLFDKLSLLKKVTHDNQELLKLFIDIQYRSAQVDGLSQQKLTNLNIILRHLGFAPLNQQYRFYEDFFRDTQQNRNQRSEYRSQGYNNNHQSYNQSQYYGSVNLDKAFAILGVSPNAGKQEVKKAYRRLISKNHPDRLIAKGLPEAMIKMANDKTQQISKAYDEICKSKGW